MSWNGGLEGGVGCNTASWNGGLVGGVGCNNASWNGGLKEGVGCNTASCNGGLEGNRVQHCPETAAWRGWGAWFNTAS